ncbi:MAG: glycosyltransferase family 2 protein [Pirellulales bacterium]
MCRSTAGKDVPTALRADDAHRLSMMRVDRVEVPDVCVVIPVYNGAASIRAVTERVREALADRKLQIVLVDDGSADESARACRELTAIEPNCRIEFIELARNFGEHNAVLAGLSRSLAPVTAILDDDGQNPPEELPRMIEHLVRSDLDVVYGRYVDRKHNLYRRLGSRLNDYAAGWMLRKPRGIYLSSFKVMSRFLVDELNRTRVPFPYIDGVVCRSTRRIGQIDVRHSHRIAGRSGYTTVKLVRLWLNMFLGFSIWPLRAGVLLGLVAAFSSLIWLAVILIDKLFISPDVTAGIPTVLACIVLFSGVQLCVLGTIGEYIGRLFLLGSGTPPFIIRRRFDSPTDFCSGTPEDRGHRDDV